MTSGNVATGSHDTARSTSRPQPPSLVPSLTGRRNLSKGTSFVSDPFLTMKWGLTGASFTVSERGRSHGPGRGRTHRAQPG